MIYIYSLTQRALTPGFVAKGEINEKTKTESLFKHSECEGVCVLLLRCEQHDGGIEPREAAYTSTKG